MNSQNFSRIGLMGVLLGVAAFAQAGDGTPGTSSTGTMSLTVTVPPIIVIRGVTDPAGATFDGSTDVDFTDSVCVGTNGATGYSITATSTNATPGGAFQLSDGSTPPTTVDYNVAWATTSGAIAGTAFGTSGASQDFSGGPVSNIACAATNATAVITVPAANLQTVPTADYSDTLQLTVAPL